MNTPQQRAEQRPAWAKYLAWIFGVAAVAALSMLVRPSSKQTPESKIAPAAGEVPRAQLELRSSRLFRTGTTNSFTGRMVEHYPDGALRSRSAVTNGLLHGLSEGWHTNGLLQVTEHFKEGVSHGLRTKWHLNGVKQSEASIVDGQLQGLFRKWHDNGTLAEQIELVNNQPEGVALAYFPSGSIKTRAVMQNGRPVEQKSWQDGEFKQ